MRKLLLIKQETEKLNGFALLHYFLVFWGNYQAGLLLDGGVN